MSREERLIAAIERMAGEIRLMYRQGAMPFTPPEEIRQLRADVELRLNEFEREWRDISRG